jgi:hypothetical protein
VLGSTSIAQHKQPKQQQQQQQQPIYNIQF